MSDTITRKQPIITVREMTAAAMMTAVTAICAWISVPANVPFTLQTFAIFTAVLILGAKGATLSVLTYLLLGAVGVPVFAGFKGGLSIILGTTGGYMLGFLLIPLVCLGKEKIFGQKIIFTVAALLVGLLLCYTFGTSWFIHVSTKAVSVKQALKWCVIPFIIPDLMKLALALFVSYRVRKHLKFY
ncbi:MAG: biotin transporter BioY [Ruminococcus sp.]|nr:biotin transporter BioY [Ruminococcus sp.]